ncbi:MAG: hypothetical protein L3K02_06800 [Thermoplasmata archaeon]|nr:hypothetical protein [Thermoplasmata archaeon]
MNVSSSGESSPYAWWELAPGSPEPIELSPNPIIGFGNGIVARILFNGTATNGSEEWNMYISDTSTASAWNGTVYCAPSSCIPSSFDSAEWIMGVPDVGGSATTMPAFQESEFIAQNRTNGTGWNDPYTDGVTVYLENPADGSGDFVDPTGYETNAYGGAPFWLAYLVDEYDGTSLGICCRINIAVGGYGEPINSTMVMNTVASITGEGPTRLALALELFNGSQVCVDPANATTGFALGVGNTNITSTLRVCPDLVSGVFNVELLLYYDPPGILAGDSGSLLLLTAVNPPQSFPPAPLVFPSFHVIGYNVSLPVAAGASGPIDYGARLTVNTNVTVDGSYGGTFEYRLLLGSTVCGPSATTSARKYTGYCWINQTGNVTLYAEVSTEEDGETVNEASLGASIEVGPPIAVRLTATADRVEGQKTTTFYANASGGRLPYSYDWTGLPYGCSTANSSVLPCVPDLPGNYSVLVSVTDQGGGAAGNATETIQVALPLIVIALSNYSTIPGGQQVVFGGSAAGGFGPYHYSWSGFPGGCSDGSGTLPNGTTVTLLNCTPTQYGHFTIQFHVTDALGYSNSSSMSAPFLDSDYPLSSSQR